ncbi:NAD(P)/FAD-dependent oxidoreductase [Pseudoglutamicibacter albus]|uniref:NADPH-dependent 2,4-dienoyl-CoA reductase/sulfur reductase-like enzyme n=1 Tax=Pseudoglutamicibacter albus TaxID=98671 RepID=A0ABU1Z028_9MICC|nr:FAD-dependent oxidoreductase [Pseudoglutamicibacter albus]MDR7293974.1 NADPH-dependent 2,4-dienoyl-CoA reductase/sulfur reductase-like enzyme [Pseudoglutamicibacter albus]
MPVNSVAIIGGGVAGFTVARQLRSRGFDGEITMVEPGGLPYDRPPLSKGYLLGTQTLEQIQFEPREWFDENRVKLIEAEAVAVEDSAEALGLSAEAAEDSAGAVAHSAASPGNSQITVRLNNGETLTADRVVLGTGGSARKLPVPGGELEEVLQLRTRTDADLLRESITPGTRVVIVGAGLIGAEIASTLLELGADVTLVEPANPPLLSAVGAVLAEHLHAMHAGKGIDVIHDAPARIELDGPERVVTLIDGTQVRADQVLVGIGITPNTALAERLGLEVTDGVLVDECQRTSNPAIFAVGDAARIRTPEGELLPRAEHWENAMNSGSRAAAAILGQEPSPAESVHAAAWFWSDRHGVHVEGVGSLVAGRESETQFVHRFNEDGSPQATFLLNSDGTMAGCAAVDGGVTVRAARRIIDQGLVVPPDALADPSVPLRKLARPPLKT